MLDPLVRHISGKKVLYGIYDFRHRVTKEVSEFYYIDNAILDYYDGWLNDALSIEDNLLNTNNLFYFRKICNQLLDVYKFEEDKQVETKSDSSVETISSEKTINPKPHIFKDGYAYGVFKKYYHAFKDDDNQLANFSFIFHAMQKDGLIHENIKHRIFIDFLAENDIYIDRIKTFGTIGKTKEKNIAYQSFK